MYQVLNVVTGMIWNRTVIWRENMVSKKNHCSSCNIGVFADKLKALIGGLFQVYETNKFTNQWFASPHEPPFPKIAERPSI